MADWWFRYEKGAVLFNRLALFFFFFKKTIAFPLKC